MDTELKLTALLWSAAPPHERRLRLTPDQGFDAIEHALAHPLVSMRLDVLELAPGLGGKLPLRRIREAFLAFGSPRQQACAFWLERIPTPARHVLALTPIVWTAPWDTEANKPSLGFDLERAREHLALLLPWTAHHEHALMELPANDSWAVCLDRERGFRYELVDLPAA